MGRGILALSILGMGCGSDKGVTIHNSDPAAAILGPIEGTLFESDETINFEGVVEDAQTPYDLLDVTWATDRSGIIAEDVEPDVDGMVFFATTGLTPGTHVVTLQVIDEGGKRATDTISIEVINDDDPPVIEAIEHPSGEESDTAQEGVDYEFEAIVRDPQDEAFDLVVTVSIEEILEDGSTEYIEVCTAIPESSGLCNCTGNMTRGMKIIQFAVEDLDGNVTTGRAELDVVPITVTDDDGDGFSEVDGDCDDTDEDVHPGAFELLNGADDDCDGIIDNNTTDYDDDGDGYSEAEGDCDDADPSISPDAPEECDGIDNNCDGLIDGGDSTTAVTTYRDLDDDGFGDPLHSDTSCETPDGYVTDNTDCNDTDETAHPGAPEVCDSIDNNCDDVIDEEGAGGCFVYYRDSDGDSYGSTESVCACDPIDDFTATSSTDCYDDNSSANPTHTIFHTLDRGDGSFDYNCDSIQEKESTDVSEECGFFSGGLGCGADEGWRGSPAACGTSGTWNYDCHYDWGCYWRERSETQACR